MRIGIRREDKTPQEARIPLVPEDITRLVNQEGIDVHVEPSSTRCFEDDVFPPAGAVLTEGLSNCPIIFGVKEIPVERLEADKTYIYFAHVIKGQPYNMDMLRRLMELKCQLIDYERIVDAENRRLVFFGRYAGLAGMIDTFSAFGRRLAHQGIENPFSRIQQARAYRDLDDVKTALKDIAEEVSMGGIPKAIQPVVCGFTGYGNVSRGAQEIFDIFPFEEITPDQLPDLSQRYPNTGNKLFKVVFREEHMFKPVGIRDFELEHYFRNPGQYRSQFSQYIEHLSMLVNCIYWAPDCPKLVTRKDVKTMFADGRKPKLKVIGDITCDVNGSIECNLQPTDPSIPVWIYNPDDESAIDGIEGNGLAMMTVDILPTELPVDSSKEFSTTLMPFIKAIASEDYSKPFADCSLPLEIKAATILWQGELTPDYKYIESFLG